MREGVRTPDALCLSNPDVFKIVAANLRKRMAEKPNAKIWSVSQDDNFSYCQCPECSKINKLAGSPSGSIINFVNKVALEFPDKTISTLAYQYSRKAPQNIVPEKNVNIMLCSIECYRTKPLAEDTSSSAFVKDLIDWANLTSNIFLWDYLVQYPNLISPFPNIQVIQPNIKLFADHKMSMMFQQGAGRCYATEFGVLKNYLIAKLLWNPNINVDSVMNDFLLGYYGPAGKYIRQYIDLLQSELIKSGVQLWIYSSPVEQIKTFLKPELIQKYNSFFDEAEKAVAGQNDILERVKIARLPLMFAMLEQSKVTAPGENGVLIKAGENKYEPNPKMISLLDDFGKITGNLNNVFINEHGYKAETYIQRYKTMLSKTMYNPLGLNKPVQFLTTPNWKHPANGEKTFTDGACGDENHLINWLGFEGSNMEVVIDLQKNEVVKKVSADFIKNTFFKIFLPEKFEVSVSTDGRNFKNVAAVNNTIQAAKDELEPNIASIINFAGSFEPVETRYVKVKAVSVKTCPTWHPSYPYKAWMFTDEIVIE